MSPPQHVIAGTLYGSIPGYLLCMLGVIATALATYLFVTFTIDHFFDFVQFGDEPEMPNNCACDPLSEEEVDIKMIGPSRNSTSAPLYTWHEVLMLVFLQAFYLIPNWAITVLLALLQYPLWPFLVSLTASTAFYCAVPALVCPHLSYTTMRKVMLVYTLAMTETTMLFLFFWLLFMFRDVYLNKVNKARFLQFMQHLREQAEADALTHGALLDEAD